MLYQVPGQECIHWSCSSALIYPLANAVSTPSLVLPLVPEVNPLVELGASPFEHCDLMVICRDVVFVIGVAMFQV